MRFVMNPDMVYQYPIWAVGLLLVGAAVFGVVLLELCARQLLPIELRQRHNDVALVQILVTGHIARERAVREPAFLCRTLMIFSKVAISTGKLASSACGGICGSSSVFEIWWR